MGYNIIADSSSNITNLKGVCGMVPLKIVTDRREFVDNSSLNLPEMLNYLETYKGRSGTSCPNVADWLDAIGDNQQTFVITITSGLSGAYNSAVQAKLAYEEQYPDRKVCVLDSLSTGPEMVLIAEKLNQLREEGVSFEQAEAAVRDYMTHTRLLFSLESLTNLARNGRVSPLVAKAADILGIRVVGCASAQGTLEPMHKCMGEKKALAVLVQSMEKMGYRGGKVRISHCCNEKGVNSLTQLLTEKYPNCDVQTGENLGLCSFYAERGGILLGFETES